jgi:hypothetical protein
MFGADTAIMYLADVASLVTSRIEIFCIRRLCSASLPKAPLLRKVVPDLRISCNSTIVHLVPRLECHYRLGYDVCKYSHSQIDSKEVGYFAMLTSLAEETPQLQQPRPSSI